MAAKKKAKKLAPKKRSPTKAARKKPAVARKKPAKRTAKAAPKRTAKAAPKRAAAKPAAPKKPAPKKPVARSKPAPNKVAESLELRASFAASPERVLAAWLDSEKHSAFTGSDASIDPRIGGKHSAWNGYIEGEILEIQPGKRLVMSWRTTEFPPDHADSIVVVEAERAGDGTAIRLVHTELPPGGAEKYGKGWTDFYFAPMATYFRSAGA